MRPMEKPGEVYEITCDSRGRGRVGCSRPARSDTGLQLERGLLRQESDGAYLQGWQAAGHAYRGPSNRRVVRKVPSYLGVPRWALRRHGETQSCDATNRCTSAFCA